MADLNARILPLHTEIPGREPDDATMAVLGKDPIDVGELVLNLEDRKIFSKRADGTIVTLGSGDADANNLLPGDALGQAIVWDGQAWVNGPVIGGLNLETGVDPSNFLSNMEADANNANGSGTEAVSYINNALFSTERKLFGTGSVYNPGSGSYAVWERSECYSLGTGPWSMEFWMRSDGTLITEGEYILNATAGTSGDYAWRDTDGNYWNAMVGNERTTFQYWDGVQVQTVIWSYANIQGASRWVHVAIQATDTEIRLWLDGVDQGAQSYAKVGDPAGALPQMFFGTFEESTDGNPVFEGWLGGVKIIRGVATYPVGNFDVPSGPFGIGDLAYSLRNLEDVKIDRAELIGGQTLLFSAQENKFINAFSRIQDSADFRLGESVPQLLQWTLGDHLNPGEYSIEADHLLLNLIDATTNDRTQLINESSLSGTLFWSTDGLDFNETPYVSRSVTSSIRIDFSGAVPVSAGTLFLSFTTPGEEAPYPLREGDTLKWDAGTGAFRPIPLSALGIEVNDLADVNTLTTPPTAGQALVWDDATSTWRPGDVATDTSDIQLEELANVSVASLTTGQFLRYDGSSWVNTALDYSQIQNAPTIASTIAALNDTDLSDAPVVGQVLTWNGFAWTPEDPIGGGGSGQTFAGAITERADITAGLSLGDGISGNLDFEGLGEAGSFVQVTASAAAWVRFYPTEADRISDVTRDEETDPSPGSGVLLEIRTTGPGQVVKITPAALYYNNDILPEQKLYARVTNRSGAPALVNVTVRAFTQTNTTAISGGTFGSG